MPVAVVRLSGVRKAMSPEFLARWWMPWAISTALAGCAVLQKPATPPENAAPPGPIRIQLDGADPSASVGVLTSAGEPLRFQVGHGRYGIACAGSTFEEGMTPIGTFRVNAILSDDRFAMDPDLVKRSGKSEAELRNNLFRNMSAIDFSGDGETGEYGIGYISLAPVPFTDQPFRFNTYDGKFRWYSFAIHGTNDDSRVGKAITGGCINVDQPTLKTLLATVQLGDEVVISSEGPCQN